MRALIVAILLMIALTGIVSAVDSTAALCPWDLPPSTFPSGSFSLEKSVASSGTGTFIGVESSVYTDKYTTNVYRDTTLATGSTLFASELSVGKSLLSTKAVEQAYGTALIDEGYAQMVISPKNLTYCDTAEGGSLTDLSYGVYASQTTLNNPIDLSYNVAVAGIKDDNAYGYANVWMNVKSMEGTNSTLLATQEVHQSNAWTGSFQFAVSDTLRITHPISSNYYTLASKVPKK
jgi:hypothetical protein